MAERQARLIGQIHRVTEGSSHKWCVIRGICGMMAEVRCSHWPMGVLVRALQAYGHHHSGDKLSEDISGRKQEKKERQAEESRPRMKREEARLRHCREILKGSGKG